MARGKKTSVAAEGLPLADGLRQEVAAWRDQGYPGVTQTTYYLLSHWFKRDEESEGGTFYKAQREAIETVIYCHEVLGGQFRDEEKRELTLKDLYEKVAPEALAGRLDLMRELTALPFAKYALKMATGSGKTWVLAALVVWQYFNALNKEREGQYSARFMVVTPGLEVLNRILDSFKGRKDKAGNRLPETSDYRRDLLMPDSPEWRGRFHLEVLEPSDLRSNTTLTDGPFVYITNWQQFVLRSTGGSLWEQYTGEDVEEAPRGEVIIDKLSEYPDLIVMNDEAHHVHGKMTAKGDELVWRRFMAELYAELVKRHGKKRGVFMQVDFSATPFFGSGEKKEYFPHIVYDYPLLSAMNDMLVKQLFLEERQAIGGERPLQLRVTAERETTESNRRGKVSKLANEQLLLIDIGRKKLEQLAKAFKAKELGRKPVMMILCEDTEVANLVAEHMDTLSDETGEPYDRQRVLVLHSELKGSELDEARKRLIEIDDNTSPLRVVVSVLMLREGFDKDNICVTVVLRTAKADLLLEQVVGRGLRQMFPRLKCPELWDSKVEAYKDIREGRIPTNSLDFLFVVEHPQFRKFYEELRAQGYAIGIGDTEAVRPTGDLVTVHAEPGRMKYDLAWPVQVFETGELPDFSKVDVAALPGYGQDFDQLKKLVGNLVIQETHAATGTKGGVWRLDNKYFDYSYFLQRAAEAVAVEKQRQLFTGRKAEIAALADEYVSTRLFGPGIDWGKPENYQVLNYILVWNHVVDNIRIAVKRLLGRIQYVPAGKWARLSDVERIDVREKTAIDARKCLYPRLPSATTGGGFERRFVVDVLDASASVVAFCKLLERRHKLNIKYRDTDGIERDYYPDFIVRTADRMFIVETKSDREAWSENVGLKARAAVGWCSQASTVRLDPDEGDQPQEWEYVLIPQSLVADQPGLSFEALLPQARAFTQEVRAKLESKLFPDE